jgi:DNA-binding winged helix-turn-helix (wHTH) protein/TolB-like protein/Tfp pilus assembly protein PilF
MSPEIGHLREFGKFRLDSEKKFLWCDGEPVALPLKALELLCLLVENRGAVVTKEEIWKSVWQDSFVEETNLTHNIYLLRKTLKEYGEGDLIQTVPRRGYRFAGDVQTGGTLVIERRAVTRIMIEETETPVPAFPRKRGVVVAAVACFLIAAITGFTVWNARQGEASNSAIRSIAVLPFITIDPTAKTEYSGLGMADVLITRLSNIKEITVRPTSAILNLHEQNSVEAGKMLSVDAVLEGTIFRTEEKTRVTVRLVRVSDQTSIWTGQFEERLQDELRLHDEIALQLVDALALKLSGSEKTALVKKYTESPDAYQTYAKGRYEWNKRSFAGMIEAQRLFRNAIEQDPGFALAYVGLADVLITGPASGEEYTLLQRALEIDPELAEAHASLGFFQMFHQWNWGTAEASFKRSIELNPNYATAHHWYATLLAIEGRNDEAKAEIHRALEINPVSHNFLADLGQIHYFAHEYREAETYCKKALEIYPNFVFAHTYLHYIYLKTGDYGRAVEEQIAAEKADHAFRDQAVGREREFEKAIGLKKAAYRHGGIDNFNRSLNAGETGSFQYIPAKRYAFLSENENALESLERSAASHEFLLAFVKADPIFDAIRDEPRFREVLRKMGLQK